MNLQNVIDQLSHGELRTVYMGDTSDGAPLDENRKGMLITHANMGLTALHTRFHLKERMAVLNLVEGQRSYKIEAEDLLRIESVRDLDDNEYVMNILNEPESLHTPDYRTLDVPTTLYGDLESPVLQVFYRANHALLNSMDRHKDSTLVEVDLPYTHLEPLILYMASRVMNPVGMESEFHTGNNYASKYELACQKLEQAGYGIDQTIRIADRFSSRGWV
jgi:hypothetical protein